MPCNDLGSGGVPVPGMEYSVETSCILNVRDMFSMLQAGNIVHVSDRRECMHAWRSNGMCIGLKRRCLYEVY